MTGMREALESALAEDFGDRAAHAAYADLLMDLPDPAERDRGELIRVQLALEDEGMPPEERVRLRLEECELLHVYQRDWFGGLAQFLHLPANPRDAHLALAAGLSGAAELTQAGAVLGTPAYTSQEQAAGEPIDPRTDQAGRADFP